VSELPPQVLLDSFGGSYPCSWRFAGHQATLAAFTPAEVEPVIRAAEEAAIAGSFAVGFVSYEAASALNPELPALPPPEGLPLAWFAVFRERLAVAPGSGLPAGATVPLQLVPQLTTAAYEEGVERIRTLIAAGDSYQTNFTFPLQGEFSADPAGLYSSVCRGQRAAFAAMLDTGSHIIVSASPELFFSLKDGIIVTRPMKGTAPRGRWPAEDRQFAAALLASGKERAENLMIVDLLRNDLGKIAVTGSVRVDSLFDIETYPTVQQLTSTISAAVRGDVTVVGIFRALFPCGSVTGAPKRRSMEIITAVERRPRGVYCGAIGCLAPGGEALFSVAIRTLVLEKAGGQISMGVGSGITYDSQPVAEYAESLGKAAFLTAGAEEFRLFETLGLEKYGCRRVDRHLGRLADSAGFFGFPLDRDEALRLLGNIETAGDEPRRVKLTLSSCGELSIAVEEILPEKSPLVIGIAATRIDPADRFLYHKTNRRELYAAELRQRPECSEVIFLNVRGELAEGSYNNIILSIGGRLLTPPLASGLLPGVLRGELLDEGVIEEQVLYAADLFAADEIWLINSLRGRRRAVLAPDDERSFEKRAARELQLNVDQI
jgi:para-aminobenzoate synthetase/4-amino-4-deoxychorismate lyase